MFNTVEIQKSLKILTSVMNQCGAEYRVLGSLIVASSLPYLHRAIPDIDVITSSDKVACIISRIEDEGFLVTNKKVGGLNHYVCERVGNADISLMGAGKFTDSYFRVSLGKFFSIKVKKDAITPTQYRFGDQAFVGIPLHTVVRGMMYSHSKPSRNTDFEALKKFGLFEYGEVNIDLYCGSIRLPYVYAVILRIKNLIGRIRLMLGKPYELSK